MAEYSEIIPTKPGFYVYRFWAEDGTCLYVGRVGDSGPRPPQSRFAHHRRMKSWWPDVARIEVAELSAHALIVAEEEAQIKALRPVHNVHRGNCQHDLSLPGAVKLSGACSKCAKQYQNSPARRAYDTSPARVAKKRENDRRRVRAGRPSGGARRWIALRRPGPGQEGLWPR